MSTDAPVAQTPVNTAQMGNTPGRMRCVKLSAVSRVPSGRPVSTTQSMTSRPYAVAHPPRRQMIELNLAPDAPRLAYKCTMRAVGDLFLQLWNLIWCYLMGWWDSSYKLAVNNCLVLSSNQKHTALQGACYIGPL